jgi:type IV pilus assembly protein PilN
MTVRVNLLPHREGRRARARKHFATVAGLTAVLGVLIVGMMHGFYARKIEVQSDRNGFLTREIVKLDKDIAEIKKLKDEIQALLARKQIIETLQADRAQTVHLLDQLVRQMPEGVYLKSVKQTGTRVKVVGYAQSNARVSTLMRNIEASQWLKEPVLVEIKATNVDKKRVSEFNLDFSLTRSVAEGADKSGAKGRTAAPAQKG